MVQSLQFLVVLCQAIFVQNENEFILLFCGMSELSVFFNAFFNAFFFADPFILSLMPFNAHKYQLNFVILMRWRLVGCWM